MIERMTQRVMKSPCGKLTDIRCLVPKSKFYLGNLIMDSHQVTTDLETLMEVSDWARADLSWWKVVLPLCSHRTKLQDPDRRPLPSAVKVYTDAAGGSMQTLGL